MSTAAGISRVRPVGVLWCLALAGALIWAMTQRDHGAQGFAVPWLAALLAVLTLAPALLRGLSTGAGGASRPAVPLLPVLGAVYALYFAAPALLGDQVSFMGLEPPAPVLRETLLLALLGWVALLFGYGVVARWCLPLRPARLEIGERSALPLAVGCLGVGLAASFLAQLGLVPDALRQPVRVLSQGLPIGLGLGVLLSRRGVLPLGLTWALWTVALPFYLVSELSEGLVGLALRAGVFVLAILWSTGARIPVLPIVAAGLCGMLLRGGAADYRVLTKFSAEAAAVSPLERAGRIAGLAGARIEADGVGPILEQSLTRVSQVALFAHVVERTPQVVPFWNGSTLLTLPLSLVPRALWAGKPVNDLGQRFGHAYGVLDADDFTTSVNLPQVVELYLNFGALGVGLGMLLMGLIYRFVSARWLARDSGLGGALLGATAFRELINVESDLSMVLGNLLQSGLVLGLVLAIAVRLDRGRASAGSSAQPAIPARLHPLGRG